MHKVSRLVSTTKRLKWLSESRVDQEDTENSAEFPWQFLNSEKILRLFLRLIHYVLSQFFFVKGFGLDEWIRRYSPPPLSRQIIGFSTATGVLLIGIGHATKFFNFFIEKKKTYSGKIRFGYATSTYDDTIDFDIIDNSQYCYHLRLTIGMGSEVYLGFNYAIIEYEYIT